MGRLAQTLGLTLTTASRFIFLAAALLTLPIAADLVAKSENRESSLGLKILLYEPFHFAYPLLAVLAFAVLGWREARLKGNSVKVGAFAGAMIGIAWFTITFIVTLQVHFSLGGRL